MPEGNDPNLLAEEEKKKNTDVAKDPDPSKFMSDAAGGSDKDDKDKDKDDKKKPPSASMGALAEASSGLSPDVRALLEAMEMLAQATEELSATVNEKFGISQKIKDSIKSAFSKDQPEEPGNELENVEPENDEIEMEDVELGSPGDTSQPPGVDNEETQLAMQQNDDLVTEQTPTPTDESPDLEEASDLTASM